MSLGNNLFNARKKSGLSQEEAAGKLGVSRQTISKWELDETLPDICQSKKLANMYGLSLDELIEFDIDVKEILEIIDRTDAGGVLPLWRRAWEIRAKREWKQEQKSKMILFYDIISDIIN